jgi:hypothetical protein
MKGSTDFSSREKREGKKDPLSPVYFMGRLNQLMMLYSQFEPYITVYLWENPHEEDIHLIDPGDTQLRTGGL